MSKVNAKPENLKTAKPVPLSELNELHTGSLLSHLKALRPLQETFEGSDWSPEEREAAENPDLIAFKDSEIWKTAFADLKGVLATREHRSKGSKEDRQTAAHQMRFR
ncbi:hypothetical protein FEE96_21630 [Parasedimentitalea maritima]|uniref:Uncharacterized protein n=1 Tax=Parasedimentitalea maritima TaxID=2578117 RepID=A0ABY2UPH9_9RHOB|nr:hypothetical protein [Zongyanglinia marina]TLP56565.1 hypothetical protein FEE96_21630 [Zongyanglinia marina]